MRAGMAVVLAILFAVGCSSASDDEDVRPVRTFRHDSPTLVSVPVSADKIGLGYHHSCLLDAAGAAYCFGSNQDGQLGSSAPTQRCSGGTIACTPTPLEVDGSLAFAAIDGSGRHTCGLTRGGAAWCWGFGVGGQLGNGSNENSAQPAAVAGNLEFAMLEVGIAGLMTCGLVGSSAYCWGPGNQGHLGDGTTDGSNRPVQVATNLPLTSLAVGDDHACALTAGGDAWCWGRGAFGKLGRGEGGASIVPTPVVGGLQFRAIAAGAQHTCALTQAGRAYCWGFGASLGNGGTAQSNVPVAVSGDRAFATIHAGYQHTCALDMTNQAWCWGPEFSPIGDGASAARPSPVAVSGGLRFRALASGGVATCGITTGALLYCWGDNSRGTLGQSDFET